jgi:hypothetical protein
LIEFILVIYRGKCDRNVWLSAQNLLKNGKENFKGLDYFRLSLMPCLAADFAAMRASERIEADFVAMLSHHNVLPTRLYSI